MVTRAPRRFSSFRFEFQPSPPTDVLPRMDVPVFVGFAESGPLHVPVVVEDVAQFTTIFGNDLPLAWDQQRGQQVYAYLASAVRSFFENGGQRCWIVRVAGEEAQYNYFPIPGLALVDTDNTITPAFARSRSQGSWSDELQVGTSLLSRPIFVKHVQLSQQGWLIVLDAASPNDIVKGDLLRLTFSPEGYILMLAVLDVQSVGTGLAPVRVPGAITEKTLGHTIPCRSGELASPACLMLKKAACLCTSENLELEADHVSDGTSWAQNTSRATLCITAHKALWFGNHPSSNLLGGASAGIVPPTDPPTNPPTNPGQLIMFTHATERAPIPVSNYHQNDQSITLNLKLPYADAPIPGSLVRVDYNTEQLWLTVEHVHLKHNEGSPAEDTLEITGQGLWLLRQPPAPSSLPTVEKLSFTLLARRDHGYPISLADLTFSVDHPRFWKALPTDEQLYRDAEMTSDPEHSVLWKTVADTPYTDLWVDAANPRFPLAGDDVPGEIYIPLVMPGVGTSGIKAGTSGIKVGASGIKAGASGIKAGTSGIKAGASGIKVGTSPTPTYFLPDDKGVGKPLDPRVRDGLQTFSASLFLDQDMLNALTPDLLMQADFLRDQRMETCPIPTLRGIYAALTIEEASIIAIPDAYQRGWRPALPDDALPPVSSSPQYRSNEEKRGKFHNAEIHIIKRPILKLEDAPDHAGTFTLSWSGIDQPNACSILEEALRSDYSDAVQIYHGSKHHLTFYGRGQGNYYYRVRITIGTVPCSDPCPDPASLPASSDWSDGLVVSVAPTGRWRLNTEDEYDAGDLLMIQRALIRMCAARGDLFAVLTLPEHFHEDKALAYIATLKALPRQTVQSQGTLTQSPPDKIAGAYNVFPLDYGERSAFSYAALYYPWLIVHNGCRDGTCPRPARTDLRRIPPDGAACGILAERALLRGAWIAPANELLTGVVALTSMPGSGWQRLQTAQVNPLLHERRGFLSLNADTLCDEEDADLRPINVRRLLILLRRMALRLGATYVFELNNDAFRRLVQREFETMLELMFKRGAFAGNTPDTSFQVVVTTPLTPQSAEQGHFIVELRVAPSLPLTFLTLRLMQSGTIGSVTEVL